MVVYDDKPHKKLRVWKDSVKLVSDVYQIADNLPTSERFNLTSQIKRAAASIPANIAEGAARQSKPDFIRFLYYARGSISELDTHFELALTLGYINLNNRTEIDNKIVVISKQLDGLIKFLKQSPN